MSNKIYMFCIVLILVSCTKDYFDVDNNGCAYDPSKIVCFTTELLTRGTPLTNATQMTDIGVFCAYTGSLDWTTSSVLGKMFNKKLNRNTSTNVWKYENGAVEWNANNANDRFTFFAYAPFAKGIYNVSTNTTGNGIVVNGSSSTTGIPTLTYTVPTKCENQPDLMVAIPKKNFRPAPSGVPLSMKHALASIGFGVRGSGQKITKIAVKGVSVRGTLSINGETILWSNLAPVTSTQYTAGVKSNLEAGTNLVGAINADGYLMMIPQTLCLGAKLIVTVDGKEKEFDLSGKVWAAGKKYTYNINAPDYIDINGVKWATGNLVAKKDSGGNIIGCRIGKPEDGGLYFMFGSLIGWAGGLTGDGTGIPSNGTTQSPTTPAYNAKGAVAPSGRSVPSTWGDLNRWDVSSGKVPPSHDPCTHYLGSTWRLPTSAEIIGLWNNHGYPIIGPWKWDSAAKGAKYSNQGKELFIPASGYRLNTVGSLTYVGSSGYCWSASISSSNYGYNLFFFNGNVNPNDMLHRSFGLPVRCVQN